MEEKRKFRTKSFASFTISWIFLILTASGIVIYFTPAGRYANWNQWAFLYLSKESWQYVHTLFSILFIMFMIIHLFFNWRIFLGYLRSKFTEGIRLKRELALSAVIVGFFLIVAVAQWQPFWKLAEFRYTIKQTWYAPEGDMISTAEESVESRNGQDHLDEGRRTNAEPVARGGVGRMGSGIGWKTVRQFCDENGVDIDDGLKQLKNAGISARASDRIRDLADRDKIRLSEVVRYLK
ncbi:DUF4405 domain-containing protein [candidate division KSB1 bacterium]